MSHFQYELYDLGTINPGRTYICTYVPGKYAWSPQDPGFGQAALKQSAYVRAPPQECWSRHRSRITGVASVAVTARVDM